MKYILNNNDKLEIVGKQYLEGVGGYDGTDTNNAKDVASVLKGLLNATCPNDEIWYTTTDGNIVTPTESDVFGANVVSNTYENGKGVIRFDGEINEIGNSAFDSCASLASITIPDSVTSIGQSAFDGCSSLTSVTIGNSVILIRVCAFDGCSSLTNITIPDSVTTIEGDAFNGCSNLTSVTIGNSVTSIGGMTFDICPSLISVYCKPTTPPAIGGDLFDNNVSGRKIYVPIESVDAYKSSDGWVEYVDSIVGCVFEDEDLVSGENIKTINGESILGEGDIEVSAAPLITIEWDDLVALRDSSMLVPGQQYRITDYITTTTQANTISAEHQFDIIVTADTNNVLNEIARACLHEGDTYFSNAGAKLEAWQIWYCLDNDTERFEWADDNTQGRGVIYHMIDEWNNDCPYDFKNIKFKNLLDTNDLNYYYTFNRCTSNGHEDMTVILVDTYTNDYGTYPKRQATNNMISPTFDTENTKIQILNFIIFIESVNFSYGWTDYIENDIFDSFYNNKFSTNCSEMIFENSCYNNTFGDNCHTNRFGEVCYSNTFGDNCYNNTFDDNCYNNTFGDNCYNNTFGYECHSNTLGEECHSNTLGEECYLNTFGDKCRNNTFEGVIYHNKFGNNCFLNTFGGICSDNTFGNGCHSNKFGGEIYSNTFGNECRNNTFQSECRNNAFGDYCCYNKIENFCDNNTFGNNCKSNTVCEGSKHNTFGNECYSNVLSDFCQYNILGNYCQNNRFGYQCDFNTFGNNCCYNTFGNTYNTGGSYYRNFVLGDGTQYVIFASTGNASSNNYVQNYKTSQGLQGTDSNKLTVSLERNLAYEMKIAKNSNGEVKIYCEADLIA